MTWWYHTPHSMVTTHLPLHGYQWTRQLHTGSQGTRWFPQLLRSHYCPPIGSTTIDTMTMLRCTCGGNRHRVVVYRSLTCIVYIILWLPYMGTIYPLWQCVVIHEAVVWCMLSGERVCVCTSVVWFPLLLFTGKPGCRLMMKWRFEDRISRQMEAIKKVSCCSCLFVCVCCL